MRKEHAKSAPLKLHESEGNVVMTSPTLYLVPDVPPPLTVTRTALEQLLPVFDSPDTESTQAP